MGFRFRKSLKIAPCLRINFSKTGTSLSVGGKGFTTNISNRGTRQTIGIPGTGISHISYSKKSKTGNLDLTNLAAIVFLLFIAGAIILVVLVND